MLLQTIISACLVMGCMSQRSPYAPRPVDYPGLHPRFGTTTESSTDLAQRFGAPSSNLPGSLYDDSMINQVAQWPKEKQPFWYLNSAQLAAHRGFQQNGQGQAQQENSQGQVQSTTQSQQQQQRQQIQQQQDQLRQQQQQRSQRVGQN